MSTAYYALFHCLAHCCANSFVGGPGADRSNPAWHQVYRALEHGPAKSRCMQRTVMDKFPRDIVDFANTFVSLQVKRHLCAPSNGSLSLLLGITQDIADAAEVIVRFNSAPFKDRRAFAAFVLLKVRPKS